MLFMMPAVGLSQILLICLSPMLHVNNPVKVPQSLLEYLKCSSAEHAPHAHTLDDTAELFSPGLPMVLHLYR